MWIKRFLKPEDKLLTMKTKILICTLVISFFCIKPKAETYHLDLDQSIQIAKNKSFEMLSLLQDIRIAEYNLKSTTSGLKTHVDLNLTLPEYTETIRQFEDTSGIAFYSVRQLNYNGSLRINQPLPTNGSIYLQTNLTNTDDLNNAKRLMNFNTRLGLTQPLDAIYGYNNIRAQLIQAKLAYEQSQKQLKRADLDLVYNVTNVFYNLLSVQKRQELAKMNLERQTDAYEIAKNKYAAGLIKEVEALQMEVDLAEAQNNLDLAIMDQSSAANRFKELIGIDIKDSVVLNTVLEYEIVLIDPQKAVNLALQNRLEIREQEIQIELGEMSIKRQKAEGMIKSSLTAYYQKVGVSELGTDQGFFNSLDRSASDFMIRPQNYGVGLTVSVPIIDWGENKALVRSAESRLQKSLYRQEEVRRSIEREVLDLSNEVTSSLKRLQLLEKNLVIAEKSFEITLARFSNGDIASQELALERERLNNAYTSHLSAYINYQLRMADLMRKTFYDFQNDKPIL